MTTPIIRRPLRFIIISGAPNSGRMTAARIIGNTADATGPWLMDRVQTEMRERCHAIFKILEQGTNLPAPPQVFDNQMDVPLKMFDGMTPAAAYAKFRKFAEDLWGPGIMGEWLGNRIKFFQQLEDKRETKDPIRSVLVPDFRGGDTAVVEKLMEIFGAENFTHLHVTRNGAMDIHPRFGIDKVFQIKNPGDSKASFEQLIRDTLPGLYIYQEA